MEKRSFDVLLLATFLLTGLFLFWTGEASAGEDAPVSLVPDDDPPVAMFAARPLHSPPLLGGKGKSAKGAVEAFVDWASASVPEERDDARQALAAASEDTTVANTLCKIAKKAARSDGTRAMVAYALLGEMRSDKGVRCLAALLKRPPRTDGPKEFESGLSYTELAHEQLQAKAVEGLAYRGSAEADELVLGAISSHPSRTVRAAAIDAYLWNHGDGPEARLALLQVIDPADALFVDRVRREEGESAASFDAKLSDYIAAHPEVVAPDPDDDTGDGEDPEDPGKNAPPPDEGFRFEETRPECVSASAPTCNGTCETGKVCAYDDVALNCSCIVEVLP